MVDLPLFFFILVLMIGSLFAFHYGVYFYVGKFLAVVRLGWAESRVTCFPTSLFFSLLHSAKFFPHGTKTEYFSWGIWLQVGSFVQEWNKIKQRWGKFRLGTGRISSQKGWLGLEGAVQGGAGASVPGII